MTGSSNVPVDYLYALNANVSTFVSVKLSGDHDYHLWKRQMLCLMKAHNMVGLVDETISGIGASTSNTEIMDQYDSLLSGWIFASVSEDILTHVIQLNSAKEVWLKLKDRFDPTMDSDIDDVPTIMNETPENKDIMIRNQKLYRATIEGTWYEVETILRDEELAVGEVINNDGETIFHVAVGTGHKKFVKKLLDFIKDTEIIERQSLDGSTALHIAAITGNTYAADLLFKRVESLINTTNNKGHLPYVAAYLNHQFHTAVFLLKSMRPDLSQPPTDHNLLLDIIPTKQYGLALELLTEFPVMAEKDNAEVLMAIARNFPSELTRLQTLLLPSNLGDIRKGIIKKTSGLFTSVGFYSRATTNSNKSVLQTGIMMLYVLAMMPIVVYRVISFLIWIVYLSFPMLYIILWKVTSQVAPIMELVKKRKQNWENAKKVLKLVCENIDKSDQPSGSRQSLYKGPILEAACQDCTAVVAEILFRSPEAIRWKDKRGYGIFHLAVIHHSEKVYRHLFDIIDPRSLCITNIGSSGDNILHLAGRLAPLYKRKTNAAVQLKQDLQLRERTKNLVPRALMHHKNSFEETPDMVFTKEHQDMVKEAGKWMKGSAASCSIIAALITTIMFAAAITLPGGNNQETGIPLFTEETGFDIYTLSVILSLFLSTTSLLMYLSIITSRFAEQDFLFLLPIQMIISVYFLLSSTISMMISFSAALYLIEPYRNPVIYIFCIGLFFCFPTMILSKFQLRLMKDFLPSYKPIRFKKTNSHRSWFDL